MKHSKLEIQVFVQHWKWNESFYFDFLTMYNVLLKTWVQVKKLFSTGTATMSYSISIWSHVILVWQLRALGCACWSVCLGVTVFGKDWGEWRLCCCMMFEGKGCEHLVIPRWLTGSWSEAWGGGVCAGLIGNANASTQKVEAAFVADERVRWNTQVKKHES